MKKQLSVLFLLLGLVFVSFSSSTNTLAFKNDTSYEDEQIIYKSDSLDEAYFTYTTEEISVLKGNTDNSVNPLADELTKPKTIIKDYYGNFDSIPNFYPYSEYSEGYFWRGMLPVIKAEKVSYGWKVTFSGILYTYIE